MPEPRLNFSISAEAGAVAGSPTHPPGDH